MEEPILRALLTIDPYHFKAHEGNAYYHADVYNSIANGVSVDLRIVTTTKRPHLRFATGGTGTPVNFFLYEEAVQSGGTELAVRNCDRSTTNISNTKLYLTPTVTGVGIEVYHNQIPGDKKVAGTTPLGLPELILKGNTEYLFRATNNSGLPISIKHEIYWYE
jgi:hypothetical protein